MQSTIKSTPSLQTRIARRLVSSERVYHSLRRAQLLAMWLVRRPHEGDFAFFRRFEGHRGLFVDIGANSGQSAVSLSIYNRTMRIVSFEPNLTLRKSLEFTRRLLGERYDFRMLGISDTAGKVLLHIPMLGGFPVLARASMNRQAVDAFLRQIQPATSRKTSIREVEVEVQPFDTLGLHPDIVKIDVEGLEASVLRGMSKTLSEARPLLLVERSDSFGECAPILSAACYECYAYNHARNQLVKLCEANGAVNFFAIPTERVNQAWA